MAAGFNFIPRRQLLTGLLSVSSFTGENNNGFLLVSQQKLGLPIGQPIYELLQGCKLFAINQIKFLKVFGLLILFLKFIQ